MTRKPRTSSVRTKNPILRRKKSRARKQVKLIGGADPPNPVEMALPKNFQFRNAKETYVLMKEMALYFYNLSSSKDNEKQKLWTIYTHSLISMHSQYSNCRSYLVNMYVAAAAAAAAAGLDIYRDIGNIDQTFTYGGDFYDYFKRKLAAMQFQIREADLRLYQNQIQAGTFLDSTESLMSFLNKHDNDDIAHILTKLTDDELNLEELVSKKVWEKVNMLQKPQKPLPNYAAEMELVERQRAEDRAKRRADEQRVADQRRAFAEEGKREYSRRMGY
jgi:hypothetical protein